VENDRNGMVYLNIDVDNRGVRGLDSDIARCPQQSFNRGIIDLFKI
jgi:hypothetical protein